MKFSELTKRFALLQMNAPSDAYEHDLVIDAISSHIDKAENILELGCGIGRGSVLLNQKIKGNYYLLDGNFFDRGQIDDVNYFTEGDYYNSLEATREYCLQNGIPEQNLFLLDAAQKWESHDLPQIDLCFSLRSIGFHWPIDIYLGKLEPFLRPKSVLCFEIRPLVREDNTIKFQCWNDYQYKSVPNDKFRIIEYVTDKRPSYIMFEKS